MDGSSVSQSISLGDYQARTGDAWYYDPGTHQLYLQDRQGGATSSIAVSFDTSTAFSPTADARVLESSPTSNYGLSPTLGADGGADPDVESYLRFSVTGVSDPVTNVKLRLHTTSNAGSASGNGPAVYSTGTSWTETDIRWSNRPDRTTGALDDKGAIASDTWLEYDVTDAITGNGTYAFVVATSSSDGTDLYSRQATSFRPELIVTT
jgi:acid phosphatase type 7